MGCSKNRTEREAFVVNAYMKKISNQQLNMTPQRTRKIRIE